MKTVTCAMVMINGDGDILGCHGTEKPIENGYDFPKGCRDADDENDLATAIRELQEETGIILLDKERVVDAGIHPHNAKKNIHLFIYKVKEFHDLTVPEMDGYKIIKKSEREKYFYHVLQDKFKIIDKILQEL